MPSALSRSFQFVSELVKIGVNLTVFASGTLSGGANGHASLDQSADQRPHDII
jgi:hypothetical protein